MVEAPKGGSPEGWRPRRVEAPKGGAPKGGGPEGWKPRRVEAPKGGRPKISRFFLPSPATIFFLLSLSLGGPFVEFWWCLKRRGPELCTFGVRSRRRTQNSEVESDDEGNVARRDFSFPVPSVMPGAEAVRMEDSSGLPPDRVRRLSLFSGVDPVRPTVRDSDGSGTEAPTSVVFVRIPQTAQRMSCLVTFLFPRPFRQDFGGWLQLMWRQFSDEERY